MRDAQEKGIYVSLMLFEVYGFMDRDGKYPSSLWAGNVFHGPNNCNSIDTDHNGDGNGLEFFFLADPEVLEIQRSYVSRVIDTINEFDNVFFEIANELAAEPWQCKMIRFIREYEAAKPKQHLIYMSPGGRNRMGQWSRLTRKSLLEGPADLYSVTRGWKAAYRGNPPVEPGSKPVIMDMDHVAADNDGENDWNNSPATPWKLLTRGYHQCFYDHDYWKPGDNAARWETTRHDIGMAAYYASKMDLARMRPHNELATTQYCLANPGQEYLVFHAGTGAFTVEGLLPNRRYQLEWYHIEERRIVPGEAFVATVETQSFAAPFENAVVLYMVGVD